MDTAFQQLIVARTGISRRHLQPSISGVLRKLASARRWSLPILYQHLSEQPVRSELWQQLLDALLVSETYFLRDSQHFRLLRREILPPLIQARRSRQQLALRIWSAGCAAGEELYSIAMTLRELLPDYDQWQLTLLGTDIRQHSIDQARQAVYRPWSFRHTSREFQQQYFQHDDAGAHLREDIKAMVRFQQANLLDAAPLSDVDIIFCRHVLMYFDDVPTCEAEDHLYAALAPEGWLFLGQAEALQQQRTRWTLHLYTGTTLYQKTSTAVLDKPVIHGTSAPDDIAHDNSETLYKRAVTALQREDTPAAEAIIADVLDLTPNYAPAHTLLAALLANRQAHPEANAHLAATFAIDPLAADAYYIRALIALETDAPLDAIEALQAALYCQRDHALAAFTLGIVYRRQGNDAQANRQWRNVQQMLQSVDDEAFLCDVSELRAGTLRRMVASAQGDSRHANDGDL